MGLFFGLTDVHFKISAFFLNKPLFEYAIVFVHVKSGLQQAYDWQLPNIHSTADNSQPSISSSLPLSHILIFNVRVAF